MSISYGSGVVDLYSTRFRVGDVNPELDMTHTQTKERDCNRTFVFRNYEKEDRQTSQSEIWNSSFPSRIRLLPVDHTFSIEM